VPRKTEQSSISKRRLAMPQPLMLLNVHTRGDHARTSIGTVKFEATNKGVMGKHEIICRNESGSCHSNWVYNSDCNWDRARKQ
jgi:hypothetical protein